MARSFVALVLATVAAGAAVGAESRQANFIVTVSVPARATLQAIEQPARLHISAEDVVRGFKDVSARYIVESNTADGWLLRFAPRLGVATQVEVQGLQSQVVVHDDTVEVYRARAREPERLTLEYRFVLEPDAQPGSYELPIHVSATPL
jgi:hypothetical protein